MKQLIEEIDNGWEEILKEEFKASYFQELWKFVENAYQEDSCYPPKKDIFAAFKKCPYKELKVVLLGQDPYHGEDQSHGLAFSVNKGIKIPPSLRNIFKEINTDIGKEVPKSGELTHWAEQGVLLLNTTLTVKEKTPKSHQKKGWKKFTDSIIQKISDKNKNIVFLLWGGDARKKTTLIDAEKHLILESGHPSPMSAIRGHWFGNKHFSKTNDFLKEKGKDTIDW